MLRLHVSMRAADAADLFDRLADAARDADGRDGAMEEVVAAEMNQRGSPPIEVVFGNDDMERPEMTGRMVVDMEAER